MNPDFTALKKGFDAEGTHQTSSSNRKRCPQCQSRKWREKLSEKGKWKCFRCGYEWWNPTCHTAIFSKDYHIGHEKPQNTMTNHDEFLKDNSQLLSIDYHNNVYKFEILKDNPAISIGKQVKGWKNSRKEILERGELTFTRTSKNIIISIDKDFIEEIKKTSELEKKDFQIAQLFVNYAQQFQAEFNMKLNLKPILVAKEVKPIEAFKSPVQFNGETVKCVYPNGDIEWVGADAVTHFKNFIENLSLENKAADILKAMDGGFNTLAYLMTRQNEILEKVLNVSKPEGFAVKISHIFGLWLAKAKIKTIPSSKKLGGNQNVAVSK